MNKEDIQNKILKYGFELHHTSGTRDHYEYLITLPSKDTPGTFLELIYNTEANFLTLIDIYGESIWGRFITSMETLGSLLEYWINKYS